MLSIACSEFHYKSMSLNERLLLEVQSIGIFSELVLDKAQQDDDFDMNGDNSAQLLAATNVANNAQAIITTLLEEYENIFYDDNLHRCSISADSHIENSGSEVSIDDESIDMRDNSCHDAENEVDPDAEDDLECPLNGKLSESSGYAGSDLYDYEAFCSDDSDVGFPTDNHASEANSNLLFNSQSVKDWNIQIIEQQGSKVTHLDVF